MKHKLTAKQIEEWLDRIGGMIDQVGHPDYSLHEMVNSLRNLRGEMIEVARRLAGRGSMADLTKEGLDGLVAGLREWAQNEEMIDQNFTAHGKDCNKAADALTALRQREEQWEHTAKVMAKAADNEKTRAEQAEAEREAVLQGQRDLMAQTVRIRAALGGAPEGVDTEELARQVHAEREAFRKDAERYQWLRKAKLITIERDNFLLAGVSNLDAACDAAIAKGRT